MVAQNCVVVEKNNLSNLSASNTRHNHRSMANRADSLVPQSYPNNTRPINRPDNLLLGPRYQNEIDDIFGTTMWRMEDHHHHHLGHSNRRVVEGKFHTMPLHYIWDMESISRSDRFRPGNICDIAVVRSKFEWNPNVVVTCCACSFSSIIVLSNPVNRNMD